LIEDKGDDATSGRKPLDKPIEIQPKQTVLYWGDNGIHEFWESEDHSLLILRNHPESFWSAHRNHGFLFSRSSFEKIVTDLKVKLSRDRIWVRTGDKFVLQDSPKK
jgi:hypothetical protein